MKIELEFKESGQLPERCGKIIVVVENEPCEKYSIFSTYARKDRKVTFSSNKVVGWAYFPDDGEIEKILNGVFFNQEWIDFLSKNAKTK